MTMTRFDYVAPTSIEEVTGLLAGHGSDAKMLAGGQSLLILLRQRLLAPTVVISLSKVEALTGIAGTDNGLEIGAMTTYSEVARNALVNRGRADTGEGGRLRWIPSHPEPGHGRWEPGPCRSRRRRARGPARTGCIDQPRRGWNGSNLPIQ